MSTAVPSPFEGPEWERFAADVTENLLPKIDGSAFVMSITPETPDVKMYVEMGAALMLDKPILVVTLPGRPVPHKLGLVADEVVVIDLDDKPNAERVIQAAVTRMLARVTR